MANTIKIKQSSTPAAAPVPGDLVPGELAINTSDKKLYSKDGSTIITLFDGVYEAADATILRDADIGVNVAAFAHVHEGTAIDATAVTDGYVLTADGAGNSAWEAAAGGGMSDLIDDTSPQLGATLDANTFDIDMGTNTLTDTAVGNVLAPLVANANILDASRLTADPDTANDASDDGFGIHYIDNAYASMPGGYYDASLITLRYDDDYSTQIAGDFSTGKLWVRGNALGWTSWVEVWDETDFTSTDFGNWGTAYGWGNHASAGYVTFPYSQLATFTNVPSTSLDLAILLQDTAAPGIAWYQTVGTVDEKLWDIITLADQLRFRCANDSGNLPVNWMTVDRTGTAVDLVAITSAAVTMSGTLGVTGNVTIDTDGVGPMLVLGDGAGADGDSLLKFSTDRPWSFRQQSTGAGTALNLQQQNDGKWFWISDYLGANQFGFFPSSTIDPILRIADTAATDYVEMSHDGTDFNIAATNTTDVNATSGITKWNFLRVSSTRLILDTAGAYIAHGAGGAKQNGEREDSVADDATHTFTQPGSSTGGMWIIFEAGSAAETDCWVGFCAGATLVTIHDGANTVSATANPNTDTKLNVFAFGSAGDVSIKNRRGSSRNYVAHCFGS